MSRAVILGCAGLRLSAEERRFFARLDPLGFILFARNVDAPDQLRGLIGELRQSVGRADAPVMIDQEGGRVQRLRPPHWRAAPPAARFGELAESDRAAAIEAARLNARLIGGELADLGIDTVCAPVLDLRFAGAHEVIGDRAYSRDPEIVATLGRAACEGFMTAGVTPILKHIPGHGRGMVDSHLSLPMVEASRAELEGSDFRPFSALADMPWAMTAHVVFRAIDPERPATTSPKVVDQVIRGHMGFDGVLIGDDLSMQALAGSIAERAAETLAAGCDLALHCNGKMEEMETLIDAVPELSATAKARLARLARPKGPRPAAPADGAGLSARLDALLAGHDHA
jgi:beta-N-acetylhexosaminidase